MLDWSFFLQILWDWKKMLVYSQNTYIYIGIFYNVEHIASVASLSFLLGVSSLRFMFKFWSFSNDENQIYNKCRYIANICCKSKNQKERKVWLGMYAHIVQEIHEWQQQQHKAGLVHVLLQFIEAVSFFNFYCSVPCVEYLWLVLLILTNSDKSCLLTEKRFPA